MREGLRFGIAVIAALFAVAPQPLLAQEAAAGNDTAASQRVGPRELEGFSLNGTVTRQAEPQPARTDPQPRQAPTETPAAADPAPVSTPPVARTETPRPRPAESAPAGQQPALVATPSLDSFTPAPETTTSAAPAVAPRFSEPNADPAPLLAEQRPSLLPWLLALAFAVGAAAFLFWRQRSQRELATAGPPLAFAAPDPAPARAPPQMRAPDPQPAAAPPASTGVPAGIVSTRLRPWIEIEFTPTRCIVEEQRAIIEFSVAMFNSGGAPARELLLEIGIFNAGPAQDEEIGRFQAMPAGGGPRVPIIEPLRRVERSSQIAVALDKLRVFEAKGRRFFVPMLALNASYRWSGGEGRSSASFLVGRDGNGSDKMAPFRLDLGPRVFRGLGAREHHLRVRS